MALGISVLVSFFSVGDQVCALCLITTNCKIGCKLNKQESVSEWIFTCLGNDLIEYGKGYMRDKK